MIDLHLHLDGSLSKQDFIHLATIQNIKLPFDYEKLMSVDNDCKSLEQYLTCFDLPLSLLQTKEAISYAFYSLVNRLYKKGYIYVEIRFAPSLHTNKGLNQFEVVTASLEGLEEALVGKNNFNANIILCTMRHNDEKTNLETVRVASKFKGTHVVAIDLAGAEALHDCFYYKNVFEEARKNKLHITIHAGEATVSEEVNRAISLGAKRIGHGVKFKLSEENIELVKNLNIGFEFCPTSNIQTKSLKSYEDNPIVNFLNNDILVSVNSDNMSVSNTDVYKEFTHLYKHLKLSKEQIYRLLINAKDMAFVPNEEKELIKKEIDAKFEDFYQNITK